jgi:D-psicose/D-tagatose/L-ribulose 3-epimerase
VGLGVSNLLWAPADDRRVAAALQDVGIDCIDIAPSRYFDPVGPVAPAAADAVRAAWADRGIRIVGLQALLHGTGQAPLMPTLFGDEGPRAAFAARLAERIDLAARLGAPILVLGAWQHRLRGGLARDAALEGASAVLRPLAERAADAGTCVTVEPIAASYGNDFLIDHDEAAELVARIDHPGFALTLDVGCAGLAGEDLDAVLHRHGDRIRHVQLAEPGLAPLADGSPWHRQAGPLLARFLQGRAARAAPVPGVCVEALTPPGDDPVATVRQSIAVARRWYS